MGLNYIVIKSGGVTVGCARTETLSDLHRVMDACDRQGFDYVTGTLMTPDQAVHLIDGFKKES